MRTYVRTSAIALLLALTTVAPIRPWSDVQAQSLPRLFEAGRPGAEPANRPVKPHQARKARLRLDLLDAPGFTLNLFDNAERVATRTKVDRINSERFVWHGRTDDDGIVTIAVVKGVATGTVFLDGRSFEFTSDADGDYTIDELNAAAFPTEDPPLDAFDTASDLRTGLTGTATIAADGAVEIDVMVLWTPAARAAAGGTAAIQSLVLSAVANANLSYTNSLVGARLRLVHSSEVAFTETTTNIAGDLGYLRTSGDGKLDVAQTLREQYKADIVTLLGNGYAARGACGVGYLMGFVSTSFASSAFNIVDRTCAAGYLSYAHEVGHNQGLHHDPANASGTPSYTYAYGYQDPGGLFRTVLSYGGATRIPFLSSPAVLYQSRVTGKSTQDNARALSGTASVVAAFRTAAGTCSYTVTPTALSFQAGAGTATVSVTTTSGCSWTSSSGTSWVSASGAATGSGTATVAVSANGSTSRSATVVVAGQNVTVSQAAAATTCTYTVSPTALSFQATAGTATVAVTTTSGCSWTSSSGTSWVSASGAATGSGTATVAVSANGATSRSATVVVAGKSVTVSQAAGATTCTYTLSATSLSFTSAASSKSVTVTASSGCNWTSSSTSWAKVTGSGSASGTATVSVPSNSRSARTTSVVLAGKTVNISQSAAGS